MKYEITTTVETTLAIPVKITVGIEDGQHEILSVRFPDRRSLREMVEADEDCLTAVDEAVADELERLEEDSDDEEECTSCLGYGHFDEASGEPKLRGRPCGDCRGTGRV
jgi:hypothetical protein